MTYFLDREKRKCCVHITEKERTALFNDAANHKGCMN